MKLAPDDVVILGRARSPVGDFLGALKDISLVELTAAVGRAALERAAPPSAARPWSGPACPRKK